MRAAQHVRAKLQHTNRLDFRSGICDHIRMLDRHVDDLETALLGAILQARSQNELEAALSLAQTLERVRTDRATRRTRPVALKNTPEQSRPS